MENIRKNGGKEYKNSDSTRKYKSIHNIFK